jgi:hypothetical protein
VFKELTGHYVNYRKQVRPSVQALLPEEAFRLYAVSARYPHNLAGLVPWQELQPGVFECRRGADAIRVVVLRQLPQSEHNSLWHLFSAAPQLVEYARRHHRLRSTQTSSLVQRLFAGYRQEGLAMPYTMEDFCRDYVKEHLEDLPPELRREDLTPEQVTRILRAQELLPKVSPEEGIEILSVLPPEESRALLAHAPE